MQRLSTVRVRVAEAEHHLGLCGTGGRVQAAGPDPADGKFTEEGERAARQQRAGNLLDALRFGHSAAVFAGPIVRRPQAAAVSGGGDDRLRAAQPGQPQGEGIGTAQMAGQKRDGEGTGFIQHHNGGVPGFAAQMGGNGTHGNARRPHKHQRICLGKRVGGEVGQREVPRAETGGHGGGIVLRVQAVGQALRQGQPPRREGGEGDGHRVASRKPVVKPGS